MSRLLALCATLSVLLLSTLLWSQAPAPSGCASQQGAAVAEICLAPGPALGERAPLKKPCLTCALTATADLPPAPRPWQASGVPRGDVPAQGIAVSPDHGPPRA